jgi:hypothetical protein
MRPLTVCERIVPNVVTRTVRKDEKNCHLGGERAAVLKEPLHRHRPPHIAAQQARRTRQIHLSSWKPPHEQTDQHRIHQIPAVQPHIQLSLEIRVGVANELQQVVQVVADECVAGPLREEAEEAANKHALAHAGGRHHFEPGALRVEQFDADGGLDLSHFGADELGARVAFGVVVDEDAVGFFAFVFGDKKSGGLGDEASAELVRLLVEGG